MRPTARLTTRVAARRTGRRVAAGLALLAAACASDGLAVGSRQDVTLSGLLTDTHRLDGTATTVEMVMTYNGTSTASLTMTSGGVTRRCTVSLAVSNAVPVCTG